MQTRPVTDAGAIRPAPLFWVVVAATAVGGWLTTTTLVPSGVAVFVFVLAAWVLSLIFHEFAHAFVAWKGGDTSIPSKGYLSLDPRLYADPLTSIALPLFFLIIGGIGLPGGAVWINRNALRSRWTVTAMSLAGPATNLAAAVVCLVPLNRGLVDPVSQPVLTQGLAFLAFLQILAFVLNMLPVPGLDGYGAIEPHLPHGVRQLLAPISRFGLLILFLLLFQVAPVRDAFWSLVGTFLDAFDVPRDQAQAGWDQFRFWS
ncbi:MAG: site-2 protease family protein [Actinomycetota bacterium]